MNVEKTERELLAEVSQKLDRLIGLMVIQGKDLEAQINALYALGFNSATIGALVGLSDSTVRNRKLRRKTKKLK